jgi:uncharacterized protein YraI
MRRCKTQYGLILVFAVCSAVSRLATSTLAASGPAPISAKVITPGAPVHSGPGDNYYLTDTLPEGEMVEVYRRRDDGWCAIRPPADSFSWVFASNVQLDDEGLAKVIKDNAASRVGSRLSSHRDVVQVRLRRGETVKIVGKDDEGGESWYKIAPPAGEFRWVAANCLAVVTSPDDDSQRGEVTRASHDEPAKPASDTKSWELMPPPLVSTTDSPVPTKATVSTPPVPASPTPAAPAPTPSPAPKAAATPPAAIIANADTEKASTTSPKTDIAPVVSPTAASADTAHQLGDLELRLSRMVAEPPTTWNIGALQQSAEQLLSNADTSADRDAVKATLAKIDRFASIQRRSVAAGIASAPNTAPGTTAASISPSAITALPAVGQSSSPAAAAANSAAGQFDAVGVLRPVVSRRPGAPQFALVDDKGQVVTFVTATPDVNLQPYLGRRIGVVGSRGYIPEFHRAHVTASRVAPVGDTVLR